MTDVLAVGDLEATLRDRLGSLRLAVVGHVEWAEFLRVPHLPSAGEITHVTDRWETAAGGGAVTAVQLAQLLGSATLFTALGNDDLGHRAADELERRGVDVRAASRRDQPQRRVIVHLEPTGERTITVIGDRMGPRGNDALGWVDPEFDAVYFTAGDAGAVRAARRARILTATARALATLGEANVPLDALVRSANDPGEPYDDGDLTPGPRLVVATERNAGGRWRTRDGSSGRYAAVEPPGPVRDTYGCGDAFAGGLTAGLAAGLDIPTALELGARCGAWVAALDGPYGR